MNYPLKSVTQALTLAGLSVLAFPAFGADLTYQAFSTSPPIAQGLSPFISAPSTIDIAPQIPIDTSIFLTVPAKPLTEDECKVLRAVFTNYIMINYDWAALDLADPNDNTTKVDWKLTKAGLEARKKSCEAKPQVECPTSAAFKKMEEVFDSMAPMILKTIQKMDESGKLVETKVVVRADYIYYSGFRNFLMKETKEFNEKCPFPDLKPPYFKPMDGEGLSEFDVPRR